MKIFDHVVNYYCFIWCPLEKLEDVINCFRVWSYKFIENIVYVPINAETNKIDTQFVQQYLLVFKKMKTEKHSNIEKYLGLQRNVDVFC
jgi:hypothetical protein